MDKNRRKFLKIVLVGSGMLIMGKILDPLFSKSLENPLAKTNLNAKIDKDDPDTYKVVENKKNLSVYDSSGEEIFQIDNGE